MEVARVDNPTPVIEYTKVKKLTTHPEWKWVTDYGMDSLIELRQELVAKYENTPRYKFGVQIPTSLGHALRLDKLNGNNLGQEAIDNEMV